MNQRSSNKKQTNMWYKIASSYCLKPDDQSCKIYSTDMRLCPTYKMVSRTSKRCITMGLGFWRWDFHKGCQTQHFVEFPWSLSSSGIFKGKKVTNLKIPGFFQKNIFSTGPPPLPLVCFFLWNSPLLIHWLLLHSLAAG